MIPNMLTMGNLFCGLLAVLFVFEHRFFEAAIAVVLGIFFDFFDGFAARILHVSGELGKQLDSLADMVTSGVVPGLVMFKMLQLSLGIIAINTPDVVNNTTLISDTSSLEFYIPYFGFLITLGSAYRLAKFNIDTRQTSSFIGLPTPANALLILSLMLIVLFKPESVFARFLSSYQALLVITILSTYLLNAELPLFALKFKHFKWKGNEIRYVFLLISSVLLIGLTYCGIPLVIMLYIILSLLANARKATKKA